MIRISRTFITSSEFDGALSDIREPGERIKVYLCRNGRLKPLPEPLSPTAAKRVVKGLDGAPVPGYFTLVRLDDEDVEILSD